MEIDQLIEQAQTEIESITLQLINGFISVDQWQEAMRRIISDFSGRAFALPGVAVDDAYLSNVLGVQYAFLDNFALDLMESGFKPNTMARAKMYGASIRQPFSMGDVVRQAGKVLPLPSMSCEGTQCMSNCRCEWKITKLGDNDFDAYWQKEINDNCQTCIERAAQWYPVQIRDGVLL